MIIAIPTVDGVLCPHFGHCQQFAILDVDTDAKSINSTEMLTPPLHEPGVLPMWLSKLGCNVIIAGGMGGRAVELFQQNGIKVIMGAPNGKPEEIVTDYINSELATGANPCDDPAFHDDQPCGE